MGSDYIKSYILGTNEIYVNGKKLEKFEKYQLVKDYDDGYLDLQLNATFINGGRVLNVNKTYSNKILDELLK